SNFFILDFKKNSHTSDLRVVILESSSVAKGIEEISEKLLSFSFEITPNIIRQVDEIMSETTEEYYCLEDNNWQYQYNAIQ
ncbi:15237_t:CDS:2, partial [Funneliformis caledonium]